MVKKIDVSTPKYPDTYALVDDEDYERVLGYGKWTCREVGGRGNFYASRNHRVAPKKYKDVFMHRVVLNAPDGFQVDHINNDTLDNRKENLRLCNTMQNGFNRTGLSRGVEGLKGVTICQRTGRYRARINIEGKEYALGQYQTPEEAADAYDKAALKYHGEFARTNAMIRAEREKKKFA